MLRVKDSGHRGTGPQMPAQYDSTQHPRPITVVVVDDEQMIRGALARMLRGGGLDLVGEAANAHDAIELVLDPRPDVVLIDIPLPGNSGVPAIDRLALLAPASRVLVLARAEENRVVEAGHRTARRKRRPPKYLRHPRRSSPRSEQPPPENQSSPPRSPGNSCSASANATYRSPPPATTPRARSAPS